ncbi:MAG TPA: DUF885 domain-containing protein [Candidatus Limnocylindrales bacterium]|jgi:uncharacterized protein (DUF885 family)
MTTATSTPLAELADEYWETFLAFSPISATSIGDRRFDDRLDDPSPEALEAQRGRLTAFRRRAEAIDAGPLDRAATVTRSALIAQLGNDLAGLETGLEEWSVDPLEGPQVNALDLEAIQPVSTPEQARAMVERWRALGPWFDQHAANLRRGLAAGRIAVRTPVDKTVEQIEEVLARPDEELPLLKPLAEPHAGWPGADRTAFAEGLRSAVHDIVRPALARYLAVVRDEIRPAARPDERPGVLHVAGGADAYRRLIRYHTSLDLAPEAIHRIGLDEVARIDSELAELGGRVLGTSDGAAIRQKLRSDPALQFSTRDEVFATAEEALARARAAIPQWFGLLPKAPCAVVRMSEHEEKHSTIAYYRQPAVDGSRPGQYYINTYAPETRPRYEAEALAYHEAIPGHHLQIAIAQELIGLPEFRKHLGPTAFFEGWGLYTERLSDEMGLYSGDLDRIGILSFDGWRACRLVVDTGMHALGWTRQQAIDFMTEHTALAENNIANEVDRYIVWPGQALAYKIGQLEILRLRAEARDRLGSRFDIRAFHDAVLGQGALGLEALAQQVATLR